MLKRFSILLIVLAVFSGTTVSQELKKIPLTRVEKKFPGKEMVKDQGDKIILYEDVDEFFIRQKKTKDGYYQQLFAPGLTQSFDKGNPDLPLISRLIEIPSDAKVSVRVLRYDEEQVALNEHQQQQKIIPAQPSVSKSTDPKDVPFYKNKALYNTNRFYKKEIVQFKDNGYLRNKHLGYIEISPFQYNPVTNTLNILRNIEIEISFSKGSKSSDTDLKRLQSSYFDELDLKTINTVSATETKSLLNDPVKYVIVSDPMFEETLQPFIEWKTQKGFNVVDVYTDNPEVGTTTASIKSFLEDMYNNPADGVAPTFILLVGDAEQIPPFDGTDGKNHVTDLYFCEYTGDNYPDVFYGRFSATTVAELQPQIDKTLMVEKYLMPNPSYLDNVVLVAGVDENFAPTQGNGAINYLNTNYTNETHGINSYYYLYQDDSGVMSSDDQGASASIQDYISQGVSFSNYTAHCSDNGWGDPAFSNSDVAKMTNENMYPLMIGNCCESSRFENTSFAETLLRAENKGAVGYIGASNSTFWNEDYWWAVGLGTVKVDPSYEETGLGAYDRYFHLNGEAKEDWYITQGQISVAGNMAVEASTSSRKKYYWEIYHLMGDPSLTPFITVPETLVASYNPEVIVGTDSYMVNAEEDSYVAVSRDGVLLDAKRVDEAQQVTLNYDALTTVGVLDLVITKQNKQPVIEEIDIVPSTTPFVALDNYLIHDTNGNGNRQIDYGEEITLDIQVKNFSDTYDAFNVTGKLISADTNVVITDSVENYGDIPHVDSVFVNAAYTVQFKYRIDDKQMVAFELIMEGEDSEGVPYEWISQINMVVHAPEIKISDLIIDDSEGNGNGLFDPGENVNLKLVVQNSGSSAVENLSVHADLLTTLSSLTLVDTVLYNRAINAAGNDTLTFRAHLASWEKPGNSIEVAFSVQDDNYEYFTDSVSKEIVLGKVPDYLIHTYDTVFVDTKAFFYDSGGKDNDYGNNENDTIIFYPENPRGKLTVDFNMLEIEPNGTDACYDLLSLYDGDPTNSANLIDDYCNSNKPSFYAATNDKGAIGFTFSSDNTVTFPGWEAVIENTGHLVQFIVKNTSGDLLEDALVAFEGENRYTNSAGKVTFNYIPPGENLPSVMKKTGYSNLSYPVTIESDTTLQVTMTEGTPATEVTFEVFSEITPVEGAQVVFNNDTLYTTINGKAVFNNVPQATDMKYEITTEHYHPFVDSMDVALEDITREVLLDPLIYRVTFLVTDGNEPINEATIIHNAENKYTDIHGEFIFELPYALDQEFIIKKEAFDDCDTIINIDREKSVAVVLKLASGIGDPISREVKVYPNPTQRWLNIEMNNTESTHFSITIYDVLGKLIFADELDGVRNIRKTIDLSEHPKGLYFLNIKSNRGENISKRIIIQ